MAKLLELAKEKKGIFITGTGTDIGKTYVTALMAKYYKEHGINVAYYKAAISGADTIPESDAGYVKRIAGLEQPDDSMVSYLFREAAYIKNLGIEIEGVLLNNYIGDLMQKDNYYMIEELTGLKVIATVAPKGETLIF